MQRDARTSWLDWLEVGLFALMALIMGFVLWVIAFFVLMFGHPDLAACGGFFAEEEPVGGVVTGVGYPSIIVGLGLLVAVLALVRWTTWRTRALVFGVAAYAAWFVGLYFLGEFLFGPHQCVDV
jgi:hypothetical protein